MKISHSASPRNRSSRNSRSPTAGNAIAGADAAASLVTGAVLVSALASVLAPSSDVPATVWAMDVIRPRLDSWAVGHYALALTEIDHIGPQLAHKIRGEIRAG